MNDFQSQPADSVHRAQLIDAICDQTEAAWQTGERPDWEAQLATVEGPLRATLLGELLCLEVHYRRLRSETPTAEEYRERFPAASPQLIAEALASTSEPRRSQLQKREPKKLSEQSSQNLKLAETIPFATGQAGSATSAALPEMFGRYKIINVLGRGAMGVVYLAQDTQLQRKVALKVPQLSGPGQEDMIERFYREARAAATVRHPHVCPVFDVGQIAGQHFISMAFVEGHPLTTFITAATPQKPRSAAVLIRKVALGLQEAHGHGIVHRDLKPGNIMVDARGEPTVMDFGLARDFNQQDATKVTQTGMLVGTPAYMSPEQIEGEPTQIGPAADIWSLGVILYELLTKQLPFPGATIYKVVSSIQHLEPKSLSEVRSDVPAELAAICHKMMAKSIAERYASMSEVAAALARFSKAAATQTPTGAPDPTATAELSRATLSGEPAAKTEALKLTPTAIPSRPQSRLEQVTATITRLPHWRFICGGAAAVGLMLVSMLAFSLSGGAKPNETTTGHGGAQPVKDSGNSATAAAERRLFNGKDLTGWTQLPAARAQNKTLVNWEVDAQDGILRSKGLEHIDLATTEQFRDFHLRCEWRGVPGWETKEGFTPGILVRCNGFHMGNPRGIEIDFNEAVKLPSYGTGSFLAFDTPLTNHRGTGSPFTSHMAHGKIKKPVLAPYPGWNRIEIRNLRDRLTVWINDELVNEGWDIPARAGTIVLRDQQCASEFRNIRLIPLDAAEPGPIVADAPPAATPNILTGLRRLTGHKGAVPAVAITADGKFGYSGGGFPDGDRIVRKWNLTTCEQMFAYDGHSSYVEGVACDPPGKRLLTTSRDGTVRLLDGLTGEPQMVFREHQAEVIKVAMSPDGRWGASSSDDRSVRLWDLETPKEHGILFGAESPTTYVAISPNSRLVAAGSYDPELVIGELATRKILRRVNAGTCFGLAFSLDGKLLATSNPTQGFVLIFDVETGQLLQRLKLSSPTAVQFLPDGDHLLVTAGDLSIYCLNFRTGKGSAGQQLGMGVIKKMALGESKPVLILGGIQLAGDAPQLRVGEVSLPPAEAETVSYLVPTPGANATSRDVVDWILQIGGRVRLMGSTQNLKSVRELPPSGWKVEWVSLERCPLFPREVELLCKLLPLSKLELGSTTVDDDELQSLQPILRQVMDLKLGHDQIGDRTLKLLADNRGLGQLDVELTKVTDVELAKVVAQNRLKLMACDSRQFTTTLRSALQVAPRLQTIVVVSIPDQPVDLSLLKNIEPNALVLIGLNSPYGLHPAPDFSALNPATRFVSLRLQNYDLTTSDVERLIKFRQLRALTISRCKIAKEEIKRLEMALPDCQVKVTK